MARKRGIRWTPTFKKEVKRIIKNYNSKISRLNKSDLSPYLPEKEYFKNISSKYLTRKELRIKLKELENFSKRNATEKIKLNDKYTIKYNLEIARKRNRRIARQLKRELQKERETVNNYDINQLINLKHKENLLEKIKKPITNIFQLKSAEHEYNKQFSQSLMHSHFDNYFEAIEKNANFINYDENKLNYIKNKLMKLSEKDLYNLDTKSGIIQSVFDYYNVNDANGIEASLDSLYNNLDSIIQLI